ncbi:hypothetical protein [Variovorax ginsengisoli]
MNWPELWTSLEELPNENFKRWLQRSSAHLQDLEVRRMRDNRSSPETPYRSEPAEQRGGEHSGSMPEVPHERAYLRRDMGGRASETGNVHGLRKCLPTEALAPGIAVQRCMLSGIWKDSCGEEMGEPLNEIELCHLRPRIHEEQAGSSNLLKVVREQVGSSEQNFWSFVPPGSSPMSNIQRLEATGDGQVPIVAARAWRILTEAA